MRKLLVACLLLVSTCAFAKNFDVKCYSAGTLIYSKVVQDVSEIDGLLVVKDGNHIVFTNGNCVMEYVKPIYHKKK